MFGLTKGELVVLKKLSTPIKIQNFLDATPLNWEKKGETYMSPRRVLREHKMHCLEGALVAAVALWIQGEKPWVLDLKTYGDDDHVVALYRCRGYWGALSKTNHAALRYRDPVYKNLRELAVSYFHEYFSNATGRKTLRSFSTRPFNLAGLGTHWITAEEELFDVAAAIDSAPHSQIFPKKSRCFIRRADPMELQAGKIIEWKRTDPRT